MGRIFIIEESETWKTTLSKALLAYQISLCPSDQDAFKHLKEREYDLIILDVQPNHPKENNVLENIKQLAPHTPVIVTSQKEEANLIVKVMKAGAFDFVAKPYSENEIQLAVKQALENKSLKNEIDYLRRQQDVVYDFDQVISVSPVMKKVISDIKRFANTDSTILITGPSGTGKSFLSGTIHFNSNRNNKPFIKINCANIPETLLESELFGHERGAFTGANKTRAGRFEQANGGTVFLDEIGELSPGLQAKLLRVLEEKSFERLGGNRTIHTDIRIIAATNRKLEEQIADKTFREDLYYRLNVLRFHLPSLHERQECIEAFAYHLLRKVCRSVKKQINGFSPEVIDLFKRYSWPGNIRELSNTIERAALLEDSRNIQKESILLPEFPDSCTKEDSEQSKDKSVQTLNEHEKDLIINALEQSLWIQKAAAERLGLTARTLNYKIKKYGITHPRWRRNK